MKTLESKVALVSGGAEGIGRAVVERYIREGARVAVLDINEPKLQALKRDYPDQLIIVHGDVTCYEDNARAVADTVAAFGKLDIFVGNAALFDYFVPLCKIAPEKLEASFDRLFHVNLLGYLNGVRAAMEELKRNRGAVVLTVSNSGFYPGGGGILYVTSKHAVVGMIKQLAYEMAPEVRVNGVSPGATDTEMKSVEGLTDRAQPLNHINGFSENAANAVPLKRIAAPEDHTAFYVVLASNEQSPMTTGCVIHSDGGWVAR
ncbi:3-(cis-5,6-dihydroxycyclohexa-1,3-dien-1-yl)propanoate dehydrogenase [Marinobacterium sp. D7]|uniref:3-(cis-5,6-dihydroxycyclohexa-1, 3-dien-1-yl)propanoate dehydrogenase n=1 Tax=Marinobacterium ramblicola TaxID=2849041 RepID=UPI001C2CD789|nr:3-(cis-5,6-dihydroxycyclohexa-1,3-dien-1-yl)propanoate dehydrogenase [Marinobacterium ramblicola]MBV1788639.1 3-(cis-5,6-dihydroxycyclohexa-1,3-dien-1-yl)propanoate dehydrogenase [Marinobacterium ramblicola]